MKRVLVALALVSLGWSGMTVAEEEVHWTYTGDTGPKHWADLSEKFQECRLGKNQSPINILTENLIEAALPPINLNYTGRTETIINNGHTLQINVSGKNTLVTHAGAFELKQFHFHSPSEHQIDGESFPLEAHFVHQNEQGELAVVSLLFRSGDVNQTLIDFGDAAPKKAGGESGYSRPIHELMKNPTSDITQYYRYNGSLTTPPCTEGLRWYLIPVAFTISNEQIANYIELIGADARGPQPVNARIVLHGK